MHSFMFASPHPPPVPRRRPGANGSDHHIHLPVSYPRWKHGSVPAAEHRHTHTWERCPYRTTAGASFGAPGTPARLSAPEERPRADRMLPQPLTYRPHPQPSSQPAAPLSTRPFPPRTPLCVPVGLLPPPLRRAALHGPTLPHSPFITCVQRQPYPPFPIHCPPFPIPYSLSPIPYPLLHPLFPVPYSLSPIPYPLSPIHRIAGLGRDLRRPPSPTPC